MSDTVKIDVETTALTNIKNSITNAKQKLESGPKTVLAGSALEFLRTPEDFASSYLEEMAKTVDEIINAATERITGIDTLIATLEASDQDEITPPPTGDDDYPPPTGDDSSDDDSAPPTGDDDDDDDDDDPTPTDPTEVSIPITSLGNIPLSSLDGIMTSIIKLAALKNKGLDELFSDEKFADDIKKAVLESGFLPDDLKKILTDSDSIITMKLLKSILNGEYAEIFDLNTLNIGVIYTYLKKLADAKGVSLEAYLASKDYVTELKTALTGFSGTTDLLKSIDSKGAEEYQKTLYETYNGNVSSDIKEQTVEVVRTFVDYVSNESEISPDELLGNTAYAEVLKVASQGFAKSTIYAQICGCFSDAKAGSHTSSLLMGGNPEALDITKDEQTKFKAEVDNLAKSKGTTSEKLLSDATYAEDVKNLLEESTYINGADSDTGKSTKFVSNIYQNDDVKVSQNVAKNIYNAKVDDSTTFTYKPTKASKK